MHYRRLSFRYATPDDGPRLEQVDRLARRLNLSLDEFISRAIIIYYEEALDQLNDPALARQFEPGDQDEEGDDDGSSR